MSRITVNVNGLSLVHEDSGGISTATLPDVCLTPPGDAPVPYPNVARSRDLEAGSSFVRADGGNRVAVASSAFGRSTGGEPGTGGGVTSMTSGGEATFLSHSFDVTVEGRGACRLTDKMLHNRGNTIDCAGVQQAHVVDEGAGRRELARASSGDHHPKHARPKRIHRHGVDSNLPTINAAYALSLGFDFVGRYLMVSHDDPHGLTPGEAVRLRQEGLDLFALWEKGVGPNHRAVETGSVAGQYELGVHDASFANQQMSWCGGGGLPIYFTVDFKVTREYWLGYTRDARTHKPIQKSELILAYFRGINHVIGADRTGVYGTYVCVKELFDAKKVKYGWQQIWKPRGYKIDYRAQLRQYAIYPGQSRMRDWNGQGWSPEWWTDGVGDAGGVDLDLAVSSDFGQWPKV